MRVSIAFFRYNADQYIYCVVTWQCSSVIVECERLKIIHARLTLIFGWGNNTHPLYTQLLYVTNHIHNIDIRYWVSKYFRLHTEALWPLNFWSISINVMWVGDDVALSRSCAFGRQLTACRSFHQLFSNIAWLPHVSSSRSFSSICMTYIKQLSTIWIMCTRSVRRVMQLDPWINTAWQSSYRQIRIEHGPLLPWLVWHHSLKFCLYIWSAIFFLLSHLTLIGKQKSSWFAVLQHDLDSRTFAWYIRPLHMHRWIIMSYSLVTKIKKKMTHSKIGTQITFHWYVMSKMTISLSISLLTPEQSPSLRPNPISIWRLAGESICRGKRLQAQ